MLPYTLGKNSYYARSSETAASRFPVIVSEGSERGNLKTLLLPESSLL